MNEGKAGLRERPGQGKRLPDTDRLTARRLGKRRRYPKSERQGQE